MLYRKATTLIYCLTVSTMAMWKYFNVYRYRFIRLINFMLRIPGNFFYIYLFRFLVLHSEVFQKS